MRSSYRKGMSPVEWYAHMEAGREGVVDTAIKTAQTGYISRKLAKYLESVVLRYDGTCRLPDQRIVSFRYRAGADPGANVGLIAAQSIARPSTQLTLSAFHFTGQGTCGGLRRLRRLVDMSTEPRRRTSHATREPYAMRCRDLSWEPTKNLIGTACDLERIFCPGYTETCLVASPTLESEADMDAVRAAIPEALWCAAAPRGVGLAFSTEGAVERGAGERRLLRGRGATHRDGCDCPTATQRSAGIEAARRVFAAELRSCITRDSGAYIADVHFRLLADAVSCLGYLCPVTRHGIRQAGYGVLHQASFESTVGTFTRAAVRRATDPCSGNSAAVMMGKRAPSGTGAV